MVIITATLLRDCKDEEEDYIDMELSSSSSPQSSSREFEFQMFGHNSNEKETNTCTADELFYNGKLIPLHLLHHTTNTNTNITTCGDITKDKESDIQFSTMKLSKKTCFDVSPCTTNSDNTPLDSCNISPSESCRVSCELNPDDSFYEWSSELSSFINHSSKKTAFDDNSWSKKLNLVRHSVFARKLKASRAYLKSLFNKSACSDESCTKANCNAPDGSIRKVEECSSNIYNKKYLNISKKKSFDFIGRPYPKIASMIKNNGNKDGTEANVHRRSFSGAIKRHSPAKCLSSSSSTSSSNCSSGSSSSSSSFSLNSNGLNDVNSIRRSSSASEIIECSIEAAIAHCKKSQHVSDSRKESGIHSSPIFEIVDEEDLSKAGLCSI